MVLLLIMNTLNLVVTYALIALNVLIIISSELSGSYFSESGITRNITAAFMTLSFLALLLIKHFLHDRYIRRFAILTLIGLGIFSLTHVLDLFNFSELRYFLLFEDGDLALVGLVLLIIGIEALFPERSTILLFSKRVINGLFLLLIVLGLGSLFFHDELISLYGSFGFVTLLIPPVSILALGLYRMRQLPLVMPLFKKFAPPFSLAILLVALGTMLDAYYDNMLHAAKEAYQLNYFLHFLVNAGMSFMILSFLKLTKTGVYANDETP